MPRVTLVAALTASVLLGLVGCSSSKDYPSQPMPKTLQFAGVKAPETDAEKMSILASPKATVDGKEVAIGFHTILRSGEVVGGQAFGQIYDTHGKALVGADGAPWISNDNDFSSLLIGKTDGKVYMVSHFECSPGAMYVTELNQDKANGKLSPVRTRPIDHSAFGGGWIHCAGSVTPWGSHLGSEEYEPDARQVKASGYLEKDGYGNSQALYFGLDPAGTAPGYFAAGGLYAYNYGWQIEVKVNTFSDVAAAKHYAMGRLAHELGYVMPNRKTVYISDDGANVALFRFEADKAEDLSSGELFIAKWEQTGTTSGGTANLTWISLGKATDAQVKTLMDRKIQFSDIFETATLNADGSVPTGFMSINTTVGRELLKVKPGMELAASRLESRRYGALKGGTTEFNKMEGITFDPDGKVLYLAMSVVSRGMKDADAKYDVGGPNHIRLPENIGGTVYGLEVDANFVATKMYGVVSATPKTYPADSPFAANKCDVEGIAEPDNLTFIPGRGVLIIGEDTGTHQNDMIWAYDVVKKTLTRIQTTPFGSETTSPYFYPDINGWAYLMSVIQHPYGESDQGKLPAAEAKRAYTGYIGPFPAMK